MKRTYMVTYTYRKFDEAANRELVKKFLEFGEAPGVIAQYERLDGKGGVFFTEVGDEDEETMKRFELTLLYGEYMDFEITPVLPFNDALPTILKLFG
jgi:hypothetical protein